MTETLHILHTPTGLDHPYLTGPDERVPRDPVDGDMVSIGFLTRPGAVAETVRVYWTRNGRPQPPIGARALQRGTDDDRWLVELGVLDGGDTIEYWIEATGDEQTATSPMECFTVQRWRRVAGISGCEPLNDGLRLMTVGEDGRPGPWLSVAPATVPQTFRLLVDAQIVPPAASNTLPRRDHAPIMVQAGPVTLVLDPQTGQFHLPRLSSASHGPPSATTTPDDLSLTLRWREAADGRVTAVDVLGPLQPDDVLAGFGERFDALNQHGRAPDVVVYEQYKNQGNRTYLPVPFFLSSAGYGCLVEGTTLVAYDLGRTVPDRWRMVADVPQRAEASLAIDFFVGEPLDILHRFTALTGRPHTPPAWAFGPWMSSNEWNTQARVLAEVATTQEQGIPATVVVIEAWSDETTFYIWNGAQYTPRTGGEALRLSDFTFPPDGPWPDPKGMIDRLHDHGIRLLLWQIPALKQIDEPHPQHDADVAHAIEQGYVLRHANGTLYRNPAFWFHGALIPDFSCAAATTWWLDKRAYLLDDLEVDGFKTDGGEHLQGRNIQAGDGRQGDELVNAYPNLYIGAYHRFTQAHRDGDALTFSRAGHTGAGMFPAHWAGDENSTWEAYRRSIVAGLTAALSGILFWGWDIAGFSEDLPSAELYLRATAMAAFCPIMQYHSEYTPPGAPSKDRTPWNVQRHTGDARVIPLARFFARLRMNLLPYILSEAAHSAASGEPLLRPLLLDDAADPTVWRLEDQYRFGRDLLVAPVVEEGQTHRRLYLPAGTWHDLWTGAPIDGGDWIEVAAPLERIPVYVRAGTILPLNLGADGVLGEDVGNAVDRYTTLTFWLFPDGQTQRTWIDTAGMWHVLRLEQTADGAVRVTLPALPVDCTLVLRGQAPVCVPRADRSQEVLLP